MVRIWAGFILFLFFTFLLIAGDNLEKFTDCPELKDKNKADELFIAFEELAEDSLRFFLVGKSGSGNILWKVQFPLEDENINLAKLTVECTASEITLLTQFPYSAAEAWQKFEWKNGTLKLIDSGAGDPSEEAVSGAIRRALNGEGVDVSDGIMYPDRYIYGERLKKAIQDGHQKALELYKQKNLKKAIKILGDVLEVTIKLAEIITFVEKEDSNPYIYWADLWLRTDIHESEYMNALNDFGFFLQEDKQVDKSIEVFEAVLLFVPNRIVTHLNLADAYFEKANLQKPPDNKLVLKASEHYLKYRDMMQKQNKAKRIPARVNERIQ
ncbi:hypothetical protein JW964_16565 [candidate division KSB1 bacterium]|nr:hypothetical protein [candidate division KSB1 bacterium]